MTLVAREGVLSCLPEGSIIRCRRRMRPRGRQRVTGHAVARSLKGSQQKDLRALQGSEVCE